MARYKPLDYSQTKLLPISYCAQILPGSFEYALSYLIDEELDLSPFDERYKNDETGAPAYNPAVMLKIILYAYSKGIISSRSIAALCRENVIFMALSADTHPHFTTIASFLSEAGDEIPRLFSQVVMICDEEGLIGKEMFAIDGCKLPSNASKEWSGTRADFKKKLKKVERAMEHIIRKHRELDECALGGDQYEREQKQLETLHKKADKMKEWLSKNDDRRSHSGNIVKSNITDNESAKMSTSHGVIQGYTGVSAVDDKHQIIVNAGAYGEGNENHLLLPMIEGIRDIFSHRDEDIMSHVTLTADAGFHSEKNMGYLEDEGIDAYVADNRFRKRDPRFKDADRFKVTSGRARKKFAPSDFIYNAETLTCICPAGNTMHLKNRSAKVKNIRAMRFQARETDCRNCLLRSRCLRDANQSTPRQVNFFDGYTVMGLETGTQKMKRKIDTDKGRSVYGKRFGAVEPVFGNIRSQKRLDRFTLRGKKKVNDQWLLYCIVHNIEKLNNLGRTTPKKGEIRLFGDNHEAFHRKSVRKYYAFVTKVSIL